MKNRSAAAKRSNSRFSFVEETITELKKVVWLSRREIVYLTGLVLIVTIAVGLVLGVIDFGFSKLVSSFFLPGQ
ncbi:MAG: preprotein translocase subunit SecE [Chloroflexota bacterium]